MKLCSRNSFVAFAALFSATSFAQDKITEYAGTYADLAYDSSTGKLLATVPGSVAGIGNRLAWINPKTGSITQSIYVGSDPSRIVLSTTGKTAFIGLNGSAAFQTMTIATGVLGTQTSLGSDTFFGPYYAEDIAPLPGSESSVAISRFRSGVSPRHGGVAMFDGSVQRLKTTQDHTGSNVIAFGSSATTLYGLNIETTEFGLRKIAVGPDGLSQTLVKQSAGSGFGGNIQVIGNRVFISNGRAFDTLNLELQGTFSSSGILRADAANRRIFFLSGSGAARSLDVFDLDTYTLLKKIAVNNVNGTPTSLVRWGSNGLAFRTNSSELFVIESAAVPEPGGTTSVLAGLVALVLARRRGRH